MRIILASNSPRRKELLEQVLNKYSMNFEIQPSSVSEEELKQNVTDPCKLVQELSYIKAKDIYEKHKQDENDLVVIGADTIVYFENKFLGKPKDEQEAKQTLAQIQGKTSQVYTGMTVIIKKSEQINIYKSYSMSLVYMKKMNENEILEYVETKEPLDKAGSYAIQGIGSKYIEKYEGDFNTVVGMNTNELERVLKQNGILESAIRNQLILLSEGEYAKFNSKLCPDTKRQMIGIRIPALRDLAKNILKENDLEQALQLIQSEYFEEIILQGLVIAYSKIPLEEKLKYIEQFVPKIDSWAINDTFVPTLKIKNKDLDRVWEFILPYLESDKEFEIRFTIIMFLDYYITSEYVDNVIEILDKIKHEGYYVKMAVAWTLCEIGIKFNEKFIAYFENNNLDKFTHNKTISKMCESYRVSSEQKELLRNMRKK